MPEAGTYTLRATLGVPAFNRHGEESETPALVKGTIVEPGGRAFAGYAPPGAATTIIG